jgi:Icc-related predicted phosphoesterase
MVGIVGLKGFVGGFAGSSLPDFGEPLLRQVHAAATTDVVALDSGLDAVAHCDVRVVLLHYAPTDATLAGEPVGIHAFLGNARMAAPIAEHRPDLVLHGHAHSGTFAGDIDGVPVHNVAAQLLDGPVHVFELDGRGA